MAENREDIITATTRLARRMNAYTLWRSASIFALWGIGAAVVFISVSKFVTILTPTVFTALSIVGASLMAGIVKGLLMRIPSPKAAMIAASIGQHQGYDLIVDMTRIRGKYGHLPADNPVKFLRSHSQSARITTGNEKHKILYFRRHSVGPQAAQILQ